MKTRNLDDMITHLLEEIALCGQQGASPSDVLGFLDDFATQPSSSGTGDVANIETNKKITRSVDRLYQNHVWTWLTRHTEVRVGKEGQGNFMSLSQVEAYNDSLKTSEEAIRISTESGLQGTDTHDKGNQDARSEGELQVNSAKEAATAPLISRNIGSSAEPKVPLRVYTSEKRIWLAITGHGPDSVKVPGKDWVCLTIIAAHREKGILQPDLRRLSNQDKRSVPARTDRLHERGYIVKSAVQGKGLPTSLCVLKRFAPTFTQFLPMTSQIGIEDSNPLENKLLSDDRTINPYRYTQESLLLMKPLVEVMLSMLRKFKTVSLHEIKLKLGIITMGWASKVLAIFIRRLEKLGFVQRIKLGSKGKSSRESHYKRLVMLLRDPDRKGLEHAFDLTKRLKSLSNASEEGVDSEDGESDEDYDHTDAMEIDVIPSEMSGSTSQIVGFRNPAWTAERPISNILYDLVNSSGLEGISLAELKDRSCGNFFQRPIDHYVARLVGNWQLSQPLHLRHLAIVREARPIIRGSHYGHYTFDNFKTLVDRGERAWKSVEALEEVRKSHKSPKVSADAIARLDIYGFPPLAESKFEGHKNATYAECIDAANVSPFRLTSKDPIVVKRSDGSYDLYWNRSGKRKSKKFMPSRTISSGKPLSAVIPQSNQSEKKVQYKSLGRPRLFPTSGLPSDVSNLSEKQLKRLRQSQHAAKKYRKSKLENEIDMRTKEYGESWEDARKYVIAEFTQESIDVPFDLESELPKSRPVAGSNRILGIGKGDPAIEANSSASKPYFPSIVTHTVRDLVAYHNEQSPKVRKKGKSKVKNEFASKIGYYPSSIAHKFRAWRSSSEKSSPISKKKGMRRVKSMIGYYASAVTHRTALSKTQTLKLAKGSKKIRRSTVQKPKSVLGYFASIISHTSIDHSTVFDVSKRPGERRISAGLDEMSIDFHSQLLEDTGFDSLSNAIVSSPVKGAVRSRKRSSKAADLDNVNPIAKAMESRPQKRTKTTKPSTSALKRVTRDEQASEITRDVPGIHFGRKTHLKTGKRGNPPNSRLAIFKSTCLQAYSWFSQSLHAPNPCNPLTDQTTGTSFPAGVINDRPSLTDFTPAQSRSGSMVSQEASMNVLVTSPSREASLSNSDGTMAGVTLHSSIEDGDNMEIDQNNRPQASALMQIQETSAKRRVFLDTVQLLSSEQSSINCTTPSIQETIIADPTLTNGKKRKRTVRFAPELEQSGFTTSETMTTPAVAKKRRTTSSAIENSPNPTKRVYKRKATNRSLAFPMQGQRIQSESTNSEEPLFASSAQGSSQSNLTLELPSQQDDTSSISAEATINSQDLSQDLSSRDGTFLGPSPSVTQAELVALHPSLDHQAPSQKTSIHEKTVQAGNFDSLSQPNSNTQGQGNQTKLTPTSKAYRRKGKKLTRIRQNLILEILEKCGGVFPGDKELYYPFNTAWLKHDAQKQEQQLINQAVKYLVDTNRLRRQWFTIRNRQGVPEARSILTLGTIPPTDPKIKETLNNIAASGSRLYVPKEVEVLKTLRKLNELVRHGTQDLEVEDEDGPLEVNFISMAERRKRTKDFMAEKNRDPEAEKKKIEKNLQDLAEKTERIEMRKLEAERTRKIMQEKREQREAKRIARNIERLQMSNENIQRKKAGKRTQQSGSPGAEGLSTEYLSFLREEDLLTLQSSPSDQQRYRELSRMTWKNGGPIGSQFDEPSSGFGSALDDLESPNYISTLMDPKQIFHPSTGTFSVESSGLYFENFLFSMVKRLPRRSALMDPKHIFHPSTGTFSVEFSGLHFENYVFSKVKKAPRTVLPDRKGSKKPKSSKCRSSFAPVKRKKKIRSSIFKTRRLFTLQDKIAIEDDRELPKAPEGNIFKKIRPRGPNRSTYLTVDDERRILVAVIIIRTLIGGVEQNIDWTLLSIILPEYSQFFIHKRWNSLRQKYKLQINQIMSDFQDMFAKAYENDQVPPLDYENLVAYDWNWLIDWTLENLDTPMDRLPDIPETRAQLDDCYILREDPEGDTIDVYEIDGTVPIERRYNIAHRDSCAVPINLSQPHRAMTPSDHDIVKSLVKSNVITPDETYEAEIARSKFDSFDKTSTSQILKELISAKVIITGNKGRLAPGRTYDISDNFIGRFRKPPILQLADYKHAITCKMRLDSAFEQHGSIDFSPLADDSTLCVVLNLLAYGRITMRPSDPPMNEFGLMDGNYETRFMEKSRIHFPVTLTPTSSYCPGNPLLPLAVPPPNRHPADKDLDIPRCPVWYDIKGDLSPLWGLTLAIVLSILSIRPGVRKVEIEKMVKEGLEIWELECMMGWLVDVGAAEWVGDAKDMEGVMLKEWWWGVLGGFVVQVK